MDANKIRVDMTFLTGVTKLTFSIVGIVMVGSMGERKNFISFITKTGFPLGLEKMGRHFPVREKSGNFEQTGKVRENHTKYWKTEGISDKYYMLFFSDS